MDHFPSNRGWMYDRCHRGKGALKESFILGVENFKTKACQQEFIRMMGEYNVRVVSVIVQEFWRKDL